MELFKKGQFVHYAKKSYGLHSVVRYDSVDKQYLLDLDGQRFFARENRVFPISNDFTNWVDSDNVIKVSECGYQTQCTQYKKTYSLNDLFDYFNREYK